MSIVAVLEKSSFLALFLVLFVSSFNNNNKSDDGNACDHIYLVGGLNLAAFLVTIEPEVPLRPNNINYNEIITIESGSGDDDKEGELYKEEQEEESPFYSLSTIAANVIKHNYTNRTTIKEENNINDYIPLDFGHTDNHHDDYMFTIYINRCRIRVGFNKVVF